MESNQDSAKQSSDQSGDNGDNDGGGDETKPELAKPRAAGQGDDDEDDDDGDGELASGRGLDSSTPEQPTEEDGYPEWMAQLADLKSVSVNDKDGKDLNSVNPAAKTRGNNSAHGQQNSMATNGRNHSSDDTHPLGNRRTDSADYRVSSSHRDMSPSDLIEKVCAILHKDWENYDGSSENVLGVHSLFVQLDILCHSQYGNTGWKQMARWLKYEEKVEVGGRWSKPHVSTLSLHALLEIRRALTAAPACVVVLDVKPVSQSIEDFSVTIADLLAQERKLDEACTANLSRYLKKPRKHKIRHAERMSKSQEAEQALQASYRRRASMARRKSLVRRDGKDYWAVYTTYHQGVDPEHLAPYKPNKKFMHKIPVGAEAASIMIGQFEFLEEPIITFFRFQPAEVIDELTEVAIPTRFVILVFGPPKSSHAISEYFEIGRAFAALLIDKVFCEVAYKATTVQHLVDGLDEFLDDLTVLPPSIWDPITRLEPPQKTRSMDKISKRLNVATRYIGASSESAVSNEDVNTDFESLKRTGRIFGGLVSDVKNRYRHYLSDFTDALHLQCFASVIFLYFACITPIVTFGGLMGQKTDNYMGTMETLMSGAVCGILYAIFSGQPLNIIGSTGPLLVFESILYHLCKERAIDFLSFRFWIGIWVFLYLLLIVAFDMSALVRYITRFTEESFAVLISIIFIYEACSRTLEIWETHPVLRSPSKHLHGACYCTMPNFLENQLNGSLAATGDPTLVSDATTLSQLADDEGALGQNQSFLESFGNWSQVLPEDCVTFRHHVRVSYGCASVSDCTGRGWVMFGADCLNDSIISSIPDVFLLSCVLFFGTFSAAMFFRTLRNSPYFPTQVRTLVSDFAVFLAVITWTGIDAWFALDTPKLEVPKQFKPTLPDRGWIVNPLLVYSWWLIPLAALPGALATILVFLDQQITAVIVNRKEHKLKKGHGYHLDLFVLSFLIAICSLLGLPWFVAATVRAVTHVRSLIKESEVKAPGERPQMLGVREQRVTGVCIHLLIGLSTLLTSVLQYIPMPVLYGVFLYMGITSLSGVQFIERILIMLMPVKYQPDYIYLRHVKTSRVHYFTLLQILCSAIMWIIKSVKVMSIAFPLMLIGLVLVRKAMDFMFTQRDLFWLDHLLPDETRRRFEDLAKTTAAAAVKDMTAVIVRSGVIEMEELSDEKSEKPTNATEHRDGDNEEQSLKQKQDV